VLGRDPDGLSTWRIWYGKREADGVTLDEAEAPDNETALAWRWSEITEAVNRWLDTAGVRPSVNRTAEGYGITLGGCGHFGALGVHLMNAISPSQWQTRLGGLAYCSHCGKPF
jgi:hypothetical protein